MDNLRDAPMDKAVLNGLQTEIDVYLAPGQVVHVHWMQGTEEASDEVIYYGLTRELRYWAKRRDEVLERAREELARAQTDRLLEVHNRAAMSEYALDTKIRLALTEEQAERYEQIMADNERLRSENSRLTEELRARGLIQ